MYEAINREALQELKKRYLETEGAVPASYYKLSENYQTTEIRGLRQLGIIIIYPLFSLISAAILKNKKQPEENTQA